MNENGNLKLLQKARLKYQNHIDCLNRRKRSYEETITDLKIKIKSIELLLQDSQKSLKRLGEEIAKEVEKNSEPTQLTLEEISELQEIKS